mmetsp:Transcript_30239/g.49962  ORF Transcript_30239/g.49962 Transcript_30239/m.49962 type:complete len:135 (+) Transcript_30239:608-1012(+)
MKKHINIRDPDSFYTDFEDDDDDDDFSDANEGYFGDANEGYGNLEDNDGKAMGEIIFDFVVILKEGGGVRHPDGMLQFSDGSTTSTREWVLQQAEKDVELQKKLIDTVGALDHIVQVSTVLVPVVRQYMNEYKR